MGYPGCLKSVDRFRKKAIDGLLGYVERHKTMMDYPKYVAAGYPIASGAIESANKRLISRRCKQGGMLWSQPGLENMVALRTAFMNDHEWRALWPHLVHDRIAT